MTAPVHKETTSARLARSALAGEGAFTSTTAFHRWLTERARTHPATITRIDFAGLAGWRFDSGSGNLVHDSGKFFSVEGLRAEAAYGPVTHWSQPIVNQPETGVLGILVKEFDGVLHCLMQAKMEPGNHNVLQLSPTVQATRSNYTAVHRGRAVPYLDFFSTAPPGAVLADVLQSEQGSWFFRKRNRNMVVETTAEVKVRDGFQWLSLGQIQRLFAFEDLLNMNSRTVLSCLPFCGPGLAVETDDADSFRSALLRSMDTGWSARQTTAEILSWLADLRSRREVVATTIPLAEISGWRRLRDGIVHDTGAFFDIRAVAVEHGDREVTHWTQPMIAPHGLGIVAFLAARFGGVLHLLVNARVEPGYLDFVELAPTVQCTPETYDRLALPRPPFLNRVLAAPAEAIRFDTVLSEEGGRFFHARNRYMVVEAGPAAISEPAEPAGPSRYRWMTVAQLVGLMRHSHYVNVQARSLIACLHSLSGCAGSRR